MDDLIDPVGELETAVFDMHAGIRVANITAVYVGIARHCPLPCSAGCVSGQSPLRIAYATPDGLGLASFGSVARSDSKGSQFAMPRRTLHSYEGGRLGD